jgi:phytoene/squalene synthetase
MQISTTQNPTYCEDMVREHYYGAYLACMLAPEVVRPALFAIYALQVELAHVHHAVREEMIGHIRYAWWQEGVESLQNPAQPRAHPVFDALYAAKVPPALLLPVVVVFREAFPEHPENEKQLADSAATALLEQREPAAVQAWQQSLRTVDAHRARHGDQRRWWLLLKLMMLPKAKAA